MGKTPLSNQLFLVSLSGILLGMSVNEWNGFSFSFTAWVAFLPLFISLKEVNNFTKHALLSYFFAFIYISFALGTFLISSSLAGLLVIVLGSVLFSVPLLILFWLKRRIGYSRSLFSLALFWPIYDLFIIEKLLALPILTLSICQSAYSFLIQYIDITGYIGITYWILSLNIGGHFLFTNWKAKLPILKPALIIALHFILPLFYYAFVKNAYSNQFRKEVKVSSIQQHFPDPKTYTDSSWVGILKDYIESTDQLIQQQKPDIVIWPESAIGVTFKEHEQIQQLLLSKVLEWDAALLSGTFDVEYLKTGEQVPPLQGYLKRNYHLYNGALLLTPQFAWNVLENKIELHDLNIYRKEHAMPFTEMVPLSRQFPFLSKFALNVGSINHITPGKNDGKLHFLANSKDIVSVKPLICWDLLFSNPASIESSKPDFIAGIANESHFGKILSTMPNGLVGYSRMRSIEYRRSIVKSSPLGFTFTTSPFGEITYSLPWLYEGHLNSKVKISKLNSFYVNNHLAFPLVCLLLFLISLKPNKSLKSKKI